MMRTLKPCPICKGSVNILICDDEGNIHDEDGYEDNPWSGLAFVLEHTHEANPDCPIAHYEGEHLGVYLYDSREEAINAWNGGLPDDERTSM